MASSASGRRGRAGRPGSSLKSRELTAIIASLDEKGDGVSVSTLAARLGISEGEVNQRLSMILSAGNDAAGLPLLESSDGTRLTLAFGGGMRGRRVRLTKDETLAVQAALNYLGVPESDPLRSTIDDSLSSAPVDAESARRVLGGLEGSSEESKNLGACARAMADLGMLSFAYKGIGDSETSERRVDPKRLRPSGEHWILDAFDLDKDEMRHFRVDRMSHVVQAPAEEVSEDVSEDAGRACRVRFHDRRYLTLFDWPGLVVEDDDGETVTANIPYFGGLWLPRRLAACGGTVDVEDNEVRGMMLRYARERLDG